MSLTILTPAMVRAEADTTGRVIVEIAEEAAPATTASLPSATPVPLVEPETPSSKRGRERYGNFRIGHDLGRAAAMRPLIARHAAAHGLPPSLAEAVVRIESRYNPGARNGPNMGLTQINHRTARSLGYSGAPAGLLDPETNLRFGMKYLGEAYRLAGGDTCGTILRYQAGLRAERMTRAAQAYCGKVKVLQASAD
ncbi:lytic transglycosylase domain-containing protein [Salinarimonas soli]|nr:transglycosylase SLT domain-containing protein [Salinarimonas soli]